MHYRPLKQLSMLVFMLLTLAACSGGSDPNNDPNNGTGDPPKLTLSVKGSTSVKQGGIGSTTLSLGRVNLKDKVNLKVASAPEGVNATFSENPTQGDSVDLNVDVAETVAMGDYTVTIEGTVGDLKASANLVVKVLDKNAAGARADYNAYSATLPGWPQYSPEKPDGDKPKGDKTPLPPEIVEDVTYTCTTTPYDLTRTPEQIVTYDPDSSILWVGSMLQGKGYKDGIGSLKELPIRQRAPLVLSIDLLNNNNTVTVQDPTVASVQQAIGKLIQEATKSGLKSGSKISFNQLETNELSEVSLKLGLSYKWLSGGIKSNLDFQRKANEKTITAHFIQNMFTISMVLPQTPEDMFSDGFTKDVLDRQIQLGNLGADNIPTYVASITYGRILTFTFTSAATMTEIRAALDASYGSGSGSLTAEQKKILSEAKIGVATIGGDASDALAIIKSGDLKDYFKTDAPLTTAKPISYVVRNLGDNSIAKVSETTEYNIKECTAQPKLPVGEKVRIDLLNVKVVSDCDIGEGEMYGEFFINGEKVFNLSETGASDGEIIPLEVTPVERDYRYNSGEQIRIEGYLKDSDIGPDDEVGKWDIQTIFPPSAETANELYGTIENTSSPDCTSTLRYSLERVGYIIE